jgi:phosphoribosylaminoimidazole carboxylase (NCAIR synthetase)
MAGHYTMDACHTDQFENHLRAVLQLPLGSCEMKVILARVVKHTFGTHCSVSLMVWLVVGIMSMGVAAQ